MKTRRDFLKFGSLAILGGLMLGSKQNIFGQTVKDNDYFPIPLDAYAGNSFRSTTFEPYVNTIFEIQKNNSTDDVSLRLVEIVDGEYKAKLFSDKNVQDFNLIFEAEGSGRLKDEIYDVSHPELGKFQLFLSTVGRSGKRYQAVFSRIYS